MSAATAEDGRRLIEAIAYSETTPAEQQVREFLVGAALCVPDQATVYEAFHVKGLMKLYDARGVVDRREPTVITRGNITFPEGERVSRVWRNGDAEIVESKYVRHNGRSVLQVSTSKLSVSVDPDGRESFTFHFERPSLGRNSSAIDLTLESPWLKAEQVVGHGFVSRIDVFGNKQMLPPKPLTA